VCEVMCHAGREACMAQSLAAGQEKAGCVSNLMLCFSHSAMT
jgi:hypothetical protein